MAKVTLPTLLVRRARLADVPGVLAMFGEWEAEGSCRNLRIPPWERVEAALPLTLVAEADEVLVGFAQGRLRTAGPGLDDIFTPGQRLLAVENLFVTREQRGQGIGSRLLAALLELGADRGATGYLLSTATLQWPRAIPFYQRHGFQVWTVTMFRR